jgi:hypothetical protein
MTKLERLTDAFSHLPIGEKHKSLDMFTEDAETILFIDLDDDRIEFHVTVTASCGCCGETEFREDSLTHFLEFISDSDFEELLSLIK